MDIYSMIGDIGRAVGFEARAEKLNPQIRVRLNAIRAETSGKAAAQSADRDWKNSRPADQPGRGRPGSVSRGIARNRRRQQCPG